MTEDQVAGDHQRLLLLVAIGEEGEEDLHLIGRVLHLSDIVQADDIELVEIGQHPRQLQIALGVEQVGHEPEALHEQHLHLLLMQELAGDRGNVVTLASAQQAKTHLVIAGASPALAPCSRGHVSSGAASLS